MTDIQQTMGKIAAITLFFWILKILATTLGETAGDMISMTLDLGYGVGILITGLFLATLLTAQISAKNFHPVLFWAAIIGTTTMGTEISDFIDRTLGLGYMVGSLLLLTGLLIVLGVWYMKERNLRVYPIYDRWAETMFWLAVLFSNSLGTAFGDFLSDNAGLGYIQGALVTSGVIVVVALLHYYSRLNATLLFWIAFIFTRPFGATFGDLLTKPHEKGGLDLGTIPASIVTLALFSMVLYLSMRHEHKKVTAPTSDAQ